MYASRHRVTRLRPVPFRNTKNRILIDVDATTYAKLGLAVSSPITEPVHLQDWWERHVITLQALSNQPRDLWAGISLRNNLVLSAS
jgi:hypothetical protein